ncbi:hypothetical protein AB595_01420 [Massilia sp. WF1]|uniref:hypothetical protein n=1 Tax=unclassified Massilia TaxID=2609279 RepID=UPI000649A3E0|nr:MULTISPECIES: hypothetical protein [unclassified Massilia]ALK98906.1 hypothetical protein AM586_24635 [Massilia sp. WG5]KLU38546.1 hypothetical protein AB595_01420 [Massilia sp. WF1]
MPTKPGLHLEHLPKWAICIPLALQWFWLGLRYGSLTLPSAANPNITAGGLVGEGKIEYFEQMGPLGRAATAPYLGLRIDEGLCAAALASALGAAGIPFPVIAKPDLGLCGYGVQKLADMDALRAYIADFPKGETLVLQRYLPQEHEAGLFYARDPDSGAGRLIGLTLRDYPRVSGDGHSTLDALIRQDRRALRMLRSRAHRCPHDLHSVPAAGQTVRLATIGSTRIGGLYRDGGDLITDALTAAIDRIAREMPDFHFGRFDVRFDSAAELQAGRGFSIMEVNGAGSEAIQAWDPGTGVIAGLRMIFAKQRLLFEIGAANRQRGARPIRLRELMRLNTRQNRLIDLYPSSN